MFSPAFMRCLNNHRSSAATALHTAAKRCLQRIAAVRAAAEDKDGHLAAAISAALSRHTGFGAAAVGQTRVRNASLAFPTTAAAGPLQSACHCRPALSHVLHSRLPCCEAGRGCLARDTSDGEPVPPAATSQSRFVLPAGAARSPCPYCFPRRMRRWRRPAATYRSCRRRSWRAAPTRGRPPRAACSWWSSCAAPSGASSFSSNFLQEVLSLHPAPSTASRQRLRLGVASCSSGHFSIRKVCKARAEGSDCHALFLYRTFSDRQPWRALFVSSKVFSGRMPSQ